MKASLEGGIKPYMREDEKASVSTIKIICITIALVLFSSISVVMAANSKASNVKIIFPNDYELNIITVKTKVSDILKDNHIVLLENEVVTPGRNEQIGDNRTIQITKVETNVAKEIDEEKTLQMNDIKDTYSTVVEKIETLEVEIPYETITKDVEGIADTEEATTRIIQEGENGLKVITYKITYRDDIEVDRLVLEEKVVKEPVQKIVQVNKKQVSRSSIDRTATATVNTSAVSLAQRVENMDPKVVTLNASAYTASTCGKTATDSGYGVTASGKKAQAWYTVAAGKGYAVGTIMYIPYFADKPNGGWFVVQDRGSAISNNRVDVYMDTYNECKIFGRKNLECYIYEF